MRIVKDGEEPQKNMDLSMEAMANQMLGEDSDEHIHIELEANEDGNVELSEEMLAELMAQQQMVEKPNPYTHELNFDEINTLEDMINVFKTFNLSIDPNQWEQDKKYIKPKGE
jgi:hypothetical protein